MLDLEFWKNKKVLVTGHTGFKGGWLSTWLLNMGAKVYGYSLQPNTDPSFFEVCELHDKMDYSYTNDILDKSAFFGMTKSINPSIVFHLAAQPIVRYSYDHPVETFNTNVVGTMNVLEAVKRTPSVVAAVIVTSDKCYKNIAKCEGYVETDPLGGSDPYSASKAAAELLVGAYAESFFKSVATPNVATVRAGNVLGGGDWAKDRLIPDAFRALATDSLLETRNLQAVRPWQHVLDVLYGYMLLAENLYKDKKYQGAWNFGPSSADVTVEKVLKKFSKYMNKEIYSFERSDSSKPESNHLYLDCHKANHELNWTLKLDLDKTLSWTADWYRNYINCRNMHQFTIKQINSYCEN